ncbi:hypothetical protein [Citromicrobium sp. WPS32]|uniref:hypothetical protein n=1 Tax=Citromicrobium sp. WPS32 TaxID=1634517 RepID=UPI0006C8EA2F|nr:hypothetical protein [Citromicrobium sp. WPS32]KPM18188.1 hypothetical protein WG75_02880 [Citromicrobium sp. WPS32]
MRFRNVDELVEQLGGVPIKAISIGDGKFGKRYERWKAFIFVIAMLIGSKILETLFSQSFDWLEDRANVLGYGMVFSVAIVFIWAIYEYWHSKLPKDLLILSEGAIYLLTEVGREGGGYLGNDLTNVSADEIDSVKYRSNFWKKSIDMRLSRERGLYFSGHLFAFGLNFDDSRIVSLPELARLISAEDIRDQTNWSMVRIVSGFSAALAAFLVLLPIWQAWMIEDLRASMANSGYNGGGGLYSEGSSSSSNDYFFVDESVVREVKSGSGDPHFGNAFQFRMAEELSGKELRDPIGPFFTAFSEFEMKDIAQGGVGPYGIISGVLPRLDILGVYSIENESKKTLYIQVEERFQADRYRLEAGPYYIRSEDGFDVFMIEFGDHVFCLNTIGSKKSCIIGGGAKSSSLIVDFEESNLVLDESELPTSWPQRVSSVPGTAPEMQGEM